MNDEQNTKTERDPQTAVRSTDWLGREWVEVDNNCFDTTEGGVFKTTLLINRCKQMKRGIKRVRDAVTLEANSRDELDTKVAAYVEKPNVRLLAP